MCARKWIKEGECGTMASEHHCFLPTYIMLLGRNLGLQFFKPKTWWAFLHFLLPFSFFLSRKLCSG